MLVRMSSLIFCLALTLATAGCAHPHRSGTYRLQAVNGVPFLLPPSMDNAHMRQAHAPDLFKFDCTARVERTCEFSSELFKLKSTNGRCELAQPSLATAATYDPDSYDAQVQKLRRAGNGCVDAHKRTLSRSLIENLALPQDSILAAFYGFHVGTVELLPPMRLVIDRYPHKIDPTDPKSLDSLTTRYEVTSAAQRGISLSRIARSGALAKGGLREDFATEDDHLKDAVGTAPGAKLLYREVSKGGYEGSKRPSVLIERAESNALGTPVVNAPAVGQDSRCAQMSGEGEDCFEFHGNVTARVEIPVTVNGARKYFALGATVEHASFKLVSSTPNAQVELFRVYDGHPVEVTSDDPKAVLSLPLVDGDRIEVRASKK